MIVAVVVMMWWASWQRNRRAPPDVLARLDRGIADGRAGRVRPIDPRWLAPDDD